MKNLIKLPVALFVLLAPALALTCEYPERPTLPDGSSAPKEDMIAAQGAVKAFLASVDEYLNCIEQEEKEAIAAMGEEVDEETLKRRDDLLQKRFDAANEEKFLFGEQWNQQVRAYNTRRQAEKAE